MYMPASFAERSDEERFEFGAQRTAHVGALCQDRDLRDAIFVDVELAGDVDVDDCEVALESGIRKRHRSDDFEEFVGGLE